MTNEQIEVGKIYTTSVGRNCIEVEIQRENPKGGWDARSLATGKPIRIKDAKNLQRVAANDAGTDEEPTVTAGPSVPTAPKPKSRPPRATKDTKPKAMSCLDAAAAVLTASGAPMQVKPMIDAMHAQALWSSDAPTPHATLFSALLREINTKGAASRFKKAERGHFTLNGN